MQWVSFSDWVENLLPILAMFWRLGIGLMLANDRRSYSYMAGEMVTVPHAPDATA